AGALWLAWARPAAAAPCCGESHGLGDRLAASERAALSSALRLRERFGAWGPDGAYVPIGDGDHDRELRLDLSWLVRVGAALQIGASVPAIVTWRAVGGISSSGGGLGDVTALARYDVVPPTGRGAIPGVALTFASTI